MIKLNEQGREWLKMHGACESGYRWACESCETLDDVWATAKPEWLIWVATRPGCVDDKTLRLFAVWCARQVQHLMSDPRSINASDVAERFASGEATPVELAAAEAAARAAAWDAARAAARDAARAAARAAARDAARAAAEAAAWDAARAAAEAAAEAAAWDAARDAARAAAWDAARAAARDAAWNAARAAQATKWREMASPNWGAK